MKTNFLLISFLFFSITIHSQVFVKFSAIGNNDGSSWENAYKDPQVAFSNANEGDQIWIAAGVYKPQLSSTPEDNWFEINKGLEIYGGFDGTETMLDQRDWQNNATIFSGDILDDDEEGNFVDFKSDNAAHVLRISNSSNINIIDGIQVIGGHAQIDNYPGNVNTGPWRGGGIEFIADNMLIRNCQVSQCQGNWGAALWGYSIGNSDNVDIRIENTQLLDSYARYGANSFSNMAQLEIRDCLFENNYGIEFGGGMVIGNSNVLLEDCDFQNNEVDLSTIGAGVFFYQNSLNNFPKPTIEVKRCDFQNNVGGAGSGIMMNNFYGGSQIYVDSCYFFQNTGYFNGFGGGSGIGLQNYEDTFGGGTPSLFASVSNCTFEENGGDYGGAGYFYSNSDTMTLEMENNEFMNNSAEYDGGAIYLFSEVHLDAQFKKLKISGNEAEGQGSAISAEGVDLIIENSLIHDNEGVTTVNNSFGDLVLLGSTIADNSTFGLYQGFNGNAEIQNTILSNEVNYSSVGNATITSKGGNLSSDSTMVDDLIGFGNYLDYNNTDPLLDGNLIPEASSVCVDGGNPEGITSTTDLAGEDRVQGNEIDMGAFESPFTVDVEDVEDVEKLGIDVYPNPFIDNIFISDIEGIKTIRLISIEGKLVQVFSAQQELLIQNDLPVGVYFLELNYGEKQYYIQLEKQR